MSPSRNSRAAVELRDALAELGLVLSLRQIERWSEIGIIPRAIRGRPGRGKGSTSVLAPHTVERVSAALNILGEGSRPLHEVVLILFVRGFDIDLDKLKLSYAGALERFRGFLEESGLQDDPLSGAETLVRDLASPSSRSKTFGLLRRRARKTYGKDVADGIAEGAMINVLLAITGSPVPPDALSELATVAGWMPFFAEKLGDAGPLIDSSPEEELRDAIEVAELDALQETLDTAALSDFVAARAVVREIQAVAEEVVHFAHRAFGSSTAMGFTNFVWMDEADVAMSVLGCVAVLRRLGISDCTEIQGSYADSRQKVRGANLILDELPSELCRSLFDHGVETEMSLSDRQKFVAVVDRLKANDDVAAALEGPD